MGLNLLPALTSAGLHGSSCSFISPAAAAFMFANVRASEQAKGADLKEDGLPIHPPEVGDRVTAVTSAWQQLQRSVAAGTELL